MWAIAKKAATISHRLFRQACLPFHHTSRARPMAGLEPTDSCSRGIIPDMRPRLPLSSNQTNVRTVDVELFGDYERSNPQGAQSANLQYLCRGQLGRSDSFTASGATFGLRIVVVLFSSAFKQVRRIAAWRSATFMADVNRSPNPGCNKETDAMRQIAPLLVVMASAKHSVFPFRRVSFPSPAFTLRALAGSFINFVPESFDVLCGELRRVYINASHVSLLERSVWLGSFRRYNACASRLHFTTPRGCFQYGS